MNRLLQVLSELDERIGSTRQKFIDLSTSSLLTCIVGKDISWAILGGAVRDTLFSHNPSAYSLFHLWPDLDIAVASPLSELPILKDPSSVSESRRVAYNYFGGLKIFEKTLGYLDVWTCAQSEGNNLSISDWINMLEKIDFGLNAVAFIWPQKEVIIHPQLKEDLRSRRIEKLSKITLNKQVQGVRALALATKLERVLGIKMSLGDSIAFDLKWLLVEAGEKQVSEALDYLKVKVETGRWPAGTVELLLRKCQKIKSSQNFSAALKKTFSLELSRGNKYAVEFPKRERNFKLTF